MKARRARGEAESRGERGGSAMPSDSLRVFPGTRRGTVVFRLRGERKPGVTARGDMWPERLRVSSALAFCLATNESQNWCEPGICCCMAC